MNEMNGWGITISCDDCSMQCTSACDDCVVRFVLRDADGEAPGSLTGHEEPLILDIDQIRVVRLLGKAGLAPRLKFRAVS